MNENPSKNFILLVYLLLAVGAAVCFWQVHNFDFINLDDNLYVYENPHVLNGLTSDSVVWAFTTGESANWHPLTWLSLMLDSQLFGRDPGRFHLVNIFIHIANTLLVFIVLRKMTEALWPSFFVAAAFALHPMHVESVAWIAERKDVLSTLFWMLTLLAYVNYVKRPGLLRYMTTILLFALGLMAKPMLVTLPFVLVLLDYWPLNRFSRQIAKTDGRQSSKSDPIGFKHQLYRLVIEKIPFFVLCAISSVITFLVQRINEGLSLGSRVANAFLSYAKYIGKMFWPQDLAVFYPFDLGRYPFWQILLCIRLLLFISILVIYAGRKRRYLPVGWFWFVITLVPVIGFVQVGNQALADRYTYIPYIGLFIMIAWGLPELVAKLPYRKAALGTFLAIVLTAMALCAYRQISYWKDTATLFSHALKVTQNNYLAHGCLAEYYRKQGNNALVVEHYKKVLEIKPNFTDAVVILGYALCDQGDLDQAITCFQKALELNPKSAAAHYNLGIVLAKQGKLDEAIAQFNQAVQLMAAFAEAHDQLANALILKGRLDEAADHFRQVVESKPDWPDPMRNLALLMATHPEIKIRDVNEALRLALRACELTNNNDPIFLGSLAAAYGAAGRFPEAVDTAQKAVKFAEAANQPQIKKVIEHHLSFYRQGKPYIEPAPKH
jgi:tetratricopeptide (TPR) repeat protein